MLNSLEITICPHCGLKETEQGIDPCFGEPLKGVIGACCGHGVQEGYIAFDNGVYINFPHTDCIRHIFFHNEHANKSKTIQEMLAEDLNFSNRIRKDS